MYVMAGNFQTSRDIFNNRIWKNIIDFRLFFLIYGNAVFSKEGYRLADDLYLHRGEWCRSIRKLQEDLIYIENRKIKTYSLSVISRCIKRLVESQRVRTKTHELGTVFTVVNYELYQGFEGFKKQNMEQNMEQSGDNYGTPTEQSGNNNKNVKSDNKVKKVKKEIIKTLYAEQVSLSGDEYDKLNLKYESEEGALWGIEKLSNYKCSTGKGYKSDYHVLVGWVFDEYQKKKLSEIKGGQTNDESRSGHSGRTAAELDAMSH